jgi:hypothetical protein
MDVVRNTKITGVMKCHRSDRRATKGMQSKVTASTIFPEVTILLARKGAQH